MRSPRPAPKTARPTHRAPRGAPLSSPSSSPQWVYRLPECLLGPYVRPALFLKLQDPGDSRLDHPSFGNECDIFVLLPRLNAHRVSAPGKSDVLHFATH